MNLKPMQTNDESSHTEWSFWLDSGRVHFAIKVKGSVPVDFAESALADAVQRKNAAVILGDAISLDLLLAGLKKEALNDFGTIVEWGRKASD
jgi:hypothetical protein